MTDHCYKKIATKRATPERAAEPSHEREREREHVVEPEESPSTTSLELVAENVRITMMDAMNVIFYELEKTDTYSNMNAGVVVTLISCLGD
ncbi:hypothetical protein diail_12012, partial [Diaporthe ilicicola]